MQKKPWIISKLLYWEMTPSATRRKSQNSWNFRFVTIWKKEPAE
jgi:hypothetical protein